MCKFTIRHAGGNYIVRCLLLVALLFALAGCSDELLLGEGLGDAGSLEVETIANGAFIGPEDEIPISVSYLNIGPQADEPPNRMEVLISAPDGSRVAERLVRSEELLAQSPSVLLPELADGLYDMDIGLYRDNRLLSSEQRSFFYVSSDWKLLGVIAYPPYIQPGSYGVLKAQLNIPAGADPYFVWRTKDKTIATGYLSQGMEQAQFQAPAAEEDADEEGVYLSRVDLYPTAPPEGTEFEFDSQVQHAVEIIVRDEPFHEDSDLAPAESYFSLLHFRGTLIEEGMRGELLGGKKQITAQSIGEPHLRLEDDIFGYYLDGDDAVRLNDIILPMTDSRPLPFALHFRLHANERTVAHTLFQVGTLDGERLFSLEVSEDGMLLARLARQEDNPEQSSESGVRLPVTRTFLLGVVVVPNEHDTEFHWLLDNEFAGSSSIAATLQLSAAIIEEQPTDEADPADVAAAPAPDTASPETSSPDRLPAEGTEADSEDSDPPVSWNRLAGYSYIGSPADGGAGFIGILDEFGIYFRDPGQEGIDIEALLPKNDEEEDE